MSGALICITAYAQCQSSFARTMSTMEETKTSIKIKLVEFKGRRGPVTFAIGDDLATDLIQAVLMAFCNIAQDVGIVWQMKDED